MNLNPIFVALDVDTENKALELAQKIAPFVGGFKVGPRLLMRYGPGLIGRLKDFGKVFVDNKYFDIPSTMESAVRATWEAGADFATVHAQAGEQALKRLAHLENELSEQREFKVLAVTVLTSFSQLDLPLTQEISISAQVQKLSKLILSCGLSGLVCSADEVQSVRAQSKNAFIVVPGIRTAGSALNDQSRISTPEGALKLGASMLVVGRPIVYAQDPARAAAEYQESIQGLY